jgi:hypothetical protein
MGEGQQVVRVEMGGGSRAPKIFTPHMLLAQGCKEILTHLHKQSKTSMAKGNDLISFLGVDLCNYFFIVFPNQKPRFSFTSSHKGHPIIGMFIGSKLSFMFFDNKTSFKNAMCKPFVLV